MPKVYHRKSSRGSWSHASMIAAAKAVQNGMSLYKASVEYGVPRNTLRARVHGDTSKKAYEKSCVLGSANEMALVERIMAEGSQQLSLHHHPTGRLYLTRPLQSVHRFLRRRKRSRHAEKIRREGENHVMLERTRRKRSCLVRRQLHFLSIV